VIAPELLLAACAGALVGGAAGLVPGVHPNTLAVLALGLLPAAGDAALPFAAALAAMGLAHQFTAIVPGSFLGAPSGEDALRALPAQELLREGRAGEAVQLAARGALAGTVAALALVAPLHWLVGERGEGYRWLEPSLPLVLACIAAVLLLTESAAPAWRRGFLADPFGADAMRGRLAERRGDLLRLASARRVWVHDPLGLHDDAPVGAALTVRGRWTRVAAPGAHAVGVALACTVFALAAALGLVVQRAATPSPLGLPASPMFPLLTGLFGAPALLLALRAPPPPVQADRPAALPRRDVAVCGAAGAGCGALVGLLPGMSSSAASVLALLAAPRPTREASILTLSAAGAGAAVITAAAYVLVGRARSGAMLAVAEAAPPQPWMGAPPPLLLALLVGCACGALVGYAGAIAAGRAAARIVHRVPYARVSAGVLALLVALVAASTGAMGLAVLGAATLVGLLPWRWGLRKGHLMGCTMGPLILGGAMTALAAA
jgi:TctA family transporter